MAPTEGLGVPRDIEPRNTADEARSAARASADLDVVAGEVMLSLATAMDSAWVEELATSVGSEVLSYAPEAGIARLLLPEGASMHGFARALSARAEIAWAGPNHIIRATSMPCLPQVATVGDIQWPLDRMEADEVCAAYGPEGPEKVEVAILDSGLAYAPFSADEGGYGAVPGLDQAAVVALSGSDVVDGDDIPGDLNGHGTHIASIIASYGSLRGAAPDVTLVPIRILDGAGVGNEAALIEGLSVAVDAGVDVINLSLAFGDHYQPTWALEQAFRKAVASGAVIIASTGNKGGEAVHYPAAFPDVVAVGATRLERNGSCANGQVDDVVAGYSSRGAAIDVVAPGGSIVHDANCDGYIDAIYGETIDSQDPHTIGERGMSGTSQAAAHASALAAWMLAEAPGLTPAQLRVALQDSANGWLGGGPGFDRASGSGLLEGQGALSLTHGATPSPEAIYVDILPVLYSDGEGQLSGHARVQVMQLGPSGEVIPMVGVRVYGAWEGSVAAEVDDITDGNGYVSFDSPPVDGVLPSGEPAPARFAFEVLAVMESPGSGARPARPLGFYHLSQGLERALEIVYGGGLSPLETEHSVVLFNVDPAEPALAAHFDAGSLTEGYVYKVLGGAGITSPRAAVFNGALLPELQVGGQPVTVDLGGSYPFGWGEAESLEAMHFDCGLAALASAPAVTLLPLDPSLIAPQAYTEPVLNAVYDIYDGEILAFNPAFASRPLKDLFSGLIQGTGFSKTIFGTITNVEMASGFANLPGSDIAGAGGGDEGDGPGDEELGSCNEGACWVGHDQDAD